MSIMCVPVVKLLCQVVMGQIPVLKYLLSGARGCLWLYLVVPSIKCLHGHVSESYGGTHCVALEVAVELKAQAETKFHMYCFVLR
jgi:hypothetical protein